MSFEESDKRNFGKLCGIKSIVFYPHFILCTFASAFEPRSERRTNDATKDGEALAHIIYILMDAKIMQVVQQGEAFAVQSQKSETGQTMKCNIVLQELGGKYENQFVAAMLGNMAQCRFYPGDTVIVTLRFSTREYNGSQYQDILVTDIRKINN